MDRYFIDGLRDSKYFVKGGYNKHEDAHVSLETFSYSLIGYRYLRLSTNLSNPQISLLKL
jgi:hypothetical protein